MVDVFRRRDQLRPVLDAAIAVGAKSIWLQQGLWDEQLARDAEAAGMRVVMDRCLKVDHAAAHCDGAELIGIRSKTRHWPLVMGQHDLKPDHGPLRRFARLLPRRTDHYHDDSRVSVRWRSPPPRSSGLAPKCSALLGFSPRCRSWP